MLCVLVLYLPYAAGLTKIEKQKPQAQTGRRARRDSDSGNNYLDSDPQATATGSLRDRVKVTSADMPIQIKLASDGVARRPKRAVARPDHNPDSYDYDLDELIREETYGESERAARQFYAGEPAGDKEAMV